MRQTDKDINKLTANYESCSSKARNFHHELTKIRPNPKAEPLTVPHPLESNNSGWVLNFLYSAGCENTTVSHTKFEAWPIRGQK